MRQAVALAFVAMVLSACSEPLEFADWTIPVPEGARVVEYAAVPLAERTERIEFVEDLVIGNDEDPDYRFYRPSGLSLGDDGTIYVLDSGNHRVQVFDQSGLFLQSWGREGQGPGEFVGPGGISIPDGRIVIVDGGRKLSLWTLDGQHIADHQISRPILRLGGAGGTLAAFYTGVEEDRSRHFVISKISVEGVKQNLLATLPRPERTIEMMTGPRRNINVTQSGLDLQAGPYPRFSVGPNGRVYVSFLAEYQVLAASASGELDWALRVAFARAPLPEGFRARTMESLRRREPEATESQLDWPPVQRALRGIDVDGHGHVYVFPILDLPDSSDEDELPVDVYSATGERLFSGFATRRNWAAVRGDYVYALAGASTDSEELSVIRYRLVEPF